MASGLAKALLSFNRTENIGLGVESLDKALCGGLACGVVHEIMPLAPLHVGAAAGFAIVLAALALGRYGRQAMWIETDFAAAEAGEPYGPGLDFLGLPMERLVILRMPCRRDALWAMEEALKCRAVSAVVAGVESRQGDDLVMRRLALAAGEGGSLGLLLRSGSARSGPAETCWKVASARSERDRFGGLGPMTFSLSLTKNRRGCTGQWHLSWNRHERIFVERTCRAAALPLSMAAAAYDGSFGKRRPENRGQRGFAAPVTAASVQSFSSRKRELACG
jgi:protein ImuA